MSNANTQALSDAGVSIWLDDLSRELLETGKIADLVKERNVVGLTSNPSIFQAAMSKGDRYNEDLARLSKDGKDVEEVVFELTTSDVREACDLFAPLYASTKGIDGRASIEVDPRLANDTDKTVEQAKKLHAAVDRENVLIKIPATKAGLPAITATIAEGISVNVTLIFSLERYRGVMNAYLEGLEAAHAAGHDLTKIHSVASFFVSRVDSEIDKRLDVDRHRGGHRPQGQGRDRQRAPRVPGLRRGLLDASLGIARRRGSQRAAPPVGLHGREGPGLPRHHVRHRARGGRRRQHHARQDPRGHRRPRRHPRRHHHQHLRAGRPRAR